MKLFYLLLFFVCFCFSNSYGQAYSDYNRKGDQAMEKKDYYEARMWYSEGLENCDLYSIRKLTDIWIDQPKMQRTMNSIITRCYVCLKEPSKAKDSNAMLILIDYYKHGIGIGVDSVQAEALLSEVVQVLGLPIIKNNNNVGNDADSTLQPGYVNNPSLTTSPPKISFAKRYNLFLTYTYSPTMPVGFSIGGFSRWGFVLSFKTSVNSQDYAYTCYNDGSIAGVAQGNSYWFEPANDKWHSWMVTGGVLMPVFTKNLFISAGGGYAKRNYYCPAIFKDGKNAVWCYNPEASYKGAVFETGGLFKYRKLIFAGGVNTVEFRDFDAYVSVGFSF